MNELENRMVSLLIQMRDEFHLVGVKGEFEAEGARLEELLRLKEIATKAGVELTTKIGGCEAITDMRFARSIGATQIVAPMIESAFAARKFVGAAKAVYPEGERSAVGLFINVETVNGARNFDDICALPEGAQLAGLDIGRVDLAGSMGLPGEECNDDRVLDTCLSMCEKWRKAFPEKECTVGGFLNLRTVRFLESIPPELKVGCESKKIVLGPGAIREGRLREAFLLAIEFEQLWYQNCMESYRQLSDGNWSYFDALPSFRAMLAEQTL